MDIATSIIIPAHNEAARLATGFERLRPVLETLDPDSTEIIIVDDGSSDDTLRVAHNLYGHLATSLFVQQPTNRGKGAAVRLGISLARGNRLITADADMAINPRHFAAILTSLENSPLGTGSRVVNGRIEYDSVLRTVADSVFNRLARHYSGTTLRDTQCGCKGFQRGPARVLGLLGMIDGFAYDVELLFLADQLGLQITPVTVTWDDVRGSSVNVRHDSLVMLHDLRSLRRTHYENPVVELSANVDVGDVARAARAVRAQGLVVARSSDDSLLVLPRDGALTGLEIANALHGTLRTAGLNELRSRTYDAV